MGVSLQLDAMAYKEMKEWTIRLYEWALFFGICSSIVIICLSCQTRCAQEGTCCCCCKKAVRGYDENVHERENRPSRHQVLPNVPGARRSSGLTRTRHETHPVRHRQGIQ